MKKWKQFLGKAIPVLLEMFECTENPEEIVHSLKELSKRLDSSSETAPNLSSTFPTYPQTMSDPGFPLPFADNSTEVPMTQFSAHVPGAGYYTDSATSGPFSEPASGTFPPPIVPSFDPSHLSFSSNASQQYQYPGAPPYYTSPQYQSMDYLNPQGYQSMSDDEFGFGNFDENINF